MKRNSARATDKIVVLGATLCLAGNAYGVPSQQFWGNLRHGHPYIPIVLLAVVGVFGAFSPFESWWNRSLADRNVIMKRRILSSFGKLLEISTKIRPPLETGDLALHVWQRKRTADHPISGVQKRIATYRMGTIPGNRAFTPAKGVGVVGLCWSHNYEISRDVSELADKLTDKAAYDAYVTHHGTDAVMRLSWRDFEKVKHRTAVFAVPIRNGRGRCVGCISVDASKGFDVLDTRELMEEISSLALAIGREDFECT